MKVLLGTNQLWGHTGSELTLLGLAQELASRGHEVACFAIFVSPLMAEVFKRERLRLIDKAAVDSFRPDAIYCQHQTAATTIRAHLPTTPMVLAHLGVEPELEQLPLLDCCAQMHLAISEEVRDRLIGQGAPPERIVIFRNAIPTRQFAVRDKHTGKKAVLFSYKLCDAHIEIVRQAAEQEELQLDDETLTQRGQTDYRAIPENLAPARVVLASGRSALEAALSGAAVVVIGPRGLDGAVTLESFDKLAEANFSGRRFAKEITIESVRKEIGHALRVDTIAVAMRTKSVFALEERSSELIHLLQQAIDAPRPQIPRANLELIRRFDTLLAEQRRMSVVQSKLARDPSNKSPDFEPEAPHLTPLSRYILADLPDLDLYRDDEPALLARASAEWRAKHADSALAYYLAAYASDTHTSVATSHLARFVLIRLNAEYEKANERTERKRALRAFLCLQPDNLWVIETLAKLAAEPYDPRVFREFLLHAAHWTPPVKTAVKTLLLRLQPALKQQAILGLIDYLTGQLKETGPRK